MHDGLAQELAFIAMQTQKLAEKSDNPATTHLADAAKRALDESRTVIADLTRAPDGPLAGALARAAERLAKRAGASLRLELDPRAERGPEARAALLRILHEAMSNGLRHGRASEIAVQLTCDEGLRFRVADNGIGFDASEMQTRFPRSFGLTSMRERARALGGELQVRSRGGRGTEVEVVLP